MLTDQIKAARRAGVPIVALSTPDPAEACRLVAGAVNGENLKLSWNIAAGLAGLTQASVDWIKGRGNDPTPFNPMALLTQVAPAVPDGGVVMALWSSELFGQFPLAQAAWNLRDLYKASNRTIVFVAPSLKLPELLAHDVLVLDDPYPDRSQLRAIADGLVTDNGLPAVTEPEPLVDALTGLTAFEAEQALAMSASKTGFSLPQVWTKKRASIKQVPGLSVWEGPERFTDIGGCENVKSFMARLVTGACRPGAVVYVDEIEKMLAGSSGDLSGTSQDQLGAVLTHMQDTKSPGSIFIGPPGAAKSALAKAVGNEAGVPTVALDLGAMKGSLVGQSEAQIRHALKVIEAVAGGPGKALWIATCNAIDSLPSALRRRFKLGTFFFDLPTPAEQYAIWTLKLEKFGLPDQARPPCADWTGAEIESCCEIAWRLAISLEEAAGFIVPVARSAATEIENLRTQADGRFISASYPGTYTTTPVYARSTTPNKRRIT